MKTVLLDLDGVLNTYKGEYDEHSIPQPQKDAEKFLEILSLEYKVVIFSTRNPKLIENWLKKNNLSKYVDKVTNIKIPAFVHVDDRCITFCEIIWKP